MSSGYMVSGSKKKINLQHNPSMSLDDVFTHVSTYEVKSRLCPASHYTAKWCQPCVQRGREHHSGPHLTSSSHARGWGMGCMFSKNLMYKIYCKRLFFTRLVTVLSVFNRLILHYLYRFPRIDTGLRGRLKCENTLDI